MCSNQHIKYCMPHGFPLTSGFLLDSIKQYIHAHTYVPLKWSCHNSILIEEHNYYLVCICLFAYTAIHRNWKMTIYLLFFIFIFNTDSTNKSFSIGKKSCRECCGQKVVSHTCTYQQICIVMRYTK